MRLFVYGTLKEGFANHEVLPTPDVIVRGEVCGELYTNGYFPALKTLEEPLKYSSPFYGVDYMLDFLCHEPDSPRVVGEMFYYYEDRGGLALMLADRLEGHTPGVRSWFYDRVMVRVSTPEGPMSAWTYRQVKPNGILLEGGEWLDRRYHAEGYTTITKGE